MIYEKSWYESYIIHYWNQKSGIFNLNWNFKFSNIEYLIYYCHLKKFIYWYYKYKIHSTWLNSQIALIEEIYMKIKWKIDILKEILKNYILIQSYKFDFIIKKIIKYINLIKISLIILIIYIKQILLYFSIN